MTYIDNNYINRLKRTGGIRLCLLAVAILCSATGFAQVTGDKYNSSYNNRDVSGTSIIHKTKTKWHDIRDEEDLSAAARNTDTFEDDVKTFDMQTVADKTIQAAHTYIDTIYVHKGTNVNLYLPTMSGSTTGTLSNRNYVRWYSYRTDGTFRLQKRDGNDPYDLLTPIGATNPYRFANGYVGGACVSKETFYGATFYYPTDSEFNSWFPNADVDNNWFIVACDVSPYNDFAADYREGGTTFGSRGTYHEPTLGDRILFYIVAVDGRNDDAFNSGYGRLKNSEYQGGGTNNKYLEEYDITFPSRHISNQTAELVALSKDARSYAIPGVTSGNDGISLSASITSTGDVLRFLNGNTSTTVSNVTRIIQFKKNNAGNNAQWDVPDGTTATILVTKTVDGKTYNIARYNLTFKDEATPLTQGQLELLATPSSVSNKWYKNLTYRRAEYMKENMNLLTSLTFDYNTELGASYGQSAYYPYPMAWGNSSYAFYDGSTSANHPVGQTRWPEWGSYSIVDDYIGYGDVQDNLPDPDPTKGGKDKGTYFIYVDASDRPGTIARLPFKEKLCQGSELFVTAWVKSAGHSATDQDDAAMLFTLMGVRTVDGVTTYTPIYRQSTGQIRTTNLLPTGEPGMGSGTNDWFQVYFSFINKSNEDYDSYIVQVDNNCASTKGGDFYFDEFKVFLVQPTAEVTQLEATCTSERTLMRMDFDYERLMSRLGHDVNGSYTESDIDGVDFCFIDEVKYNNYLNDNPGKTADAIQHAIVTMGAGGENDTEYQYPTFRFYLDFDKNTQYVEDKDGGNLAKDNMHDVTGSSTKRAFFYKNTDEAGRKQLSVDFYSLLTPNRPYIMLIKPLIEETETASAEEFAADIDNPCGIKTRFYVTTQTLLKVNGEVVDPSLDYCAGQTFNFSTQVRVPVVKDGEETYVTIDKGVYFDWFFGTEEEFLAENEQYGGISLQSALTSFRALYPDAETLDKTATAPGTNEEGDTFTQAEYDLIADYLSQPGETGGINGRLVLHKENVDIRLLDTGLRLVVQPIQTDLPPTEGISKEDWLRVCWNYIPLLLEASGDAPTLNAGFNNTQYPDDFIPSLRIGLNQIKNANSEGKALNISLRDAKMVSDDAEQLGIVTAMPDLDKIYLIGSDDPQYSEYFTGEDFDQYSLPIGKITELFAETYQQGSAFNDHVKLYFDLNTETTVGGKPFTFKPREGYFYKFSIHFEEKTSGGEGAGNACQGSFPIEMKVVPEYLVWKGNRTSNWNKDGNWQRADKTDLNKTSGYTTNEENETANGFVPMLFSKVIMPENSRAELYLAGYKDGGTSWENTNKPEYIEQPTENIQYDLMAYDSSTGLTTQRYRVDLCDQIHFKPNAQLLHSELLLYNTAWTDVVIPNKQWQLMTTPLKAVYSGDWYTATSGTQAKEEYFTDRTFDADKDNRLNPAVFQRSWSADARIIENASTTTGAPNYSQTGWTSAYNDASVPYSSGVGFSIKAYGGIDSLLFRFPKADTSYDVATGSLNREGAGKLLVSDFVNRSDPFNYKTKDEITVSPTVSTDGYCIVGNPFTAPMSMKAFMAANDNLTGSYWKETDKGPIAGSAAPGNWNTLASDGSDDELILPYQAFFVQMKQDATDKTDVKFKADMQMMDETAPHGYAAFSIKASNGSGESSAALAYADNASDGFNPNEDAVLMQDVSMQTAEVPMVYTVAGDRAVSVNRISRLQVIPLGLFGSDTQTATLTFTGVDKVKDPVLYDSKTGSGTPITEGYTLSVSGQSHGRYFIRTSGVATGITETQTAGHSLSVYSVVRGQVIVSSDTALKRIEVCTAGGTLERVVTADGMSCTIDGIDSGVTVVRVFTENGTETRKILVR